MKTRTNPGLQFLCLALACASADVAPAEPSSAAIPFAEIGAKATADYQGDALGISATADGVRLRCGFQKLEGHATAEGLWLESTAPGDGGRLRLVAESVSREGAMDDGAQSLWAGFDWAIPPAGALVFCEPDAARHCGFNERASVLECGSPLPLSVALDPSQSGRGLPHSKTLRERESLRCSPSVGAATARDGEDGVGRTACGRLARTGTVEVADKLVRFIRPGVTEEYSVSVDGVRQDFIINERPIGDGDLRVELTLAGARAEAMAYGAKLKLVGSSRTLAYSRLRATDATGKELKARMEVSPVAAEVTRLKSDGEAGNPSAAPQPGEGGKAETSQSLLTSAATAARLAVVVDDADAVYPVRIDPTFSDANWFSMGEFPGANGNVLAAVVDGSGNLYIGGNFTMVGDALATNIAKWNGSSWSALGSGVNSSVHALAVSGGDLYAGGHFTTAGGGAANYIAKWNGSSWSALGSGMNWAVDALAVSGSDLYAAGDFWWAGGNAAKYVAKWNGSSWSALGSGMNDRVYALAVSGSDLYAGGYFTTAGGNAANRIAKWDGSSWSPLGTGLSFPGDTCSVFALAVSGSEVYAGGYFATAGSSAAKCIAKWNGSSWSPLGSGMNYTVSALAVSDSGLYAGGGFTTAGGSAAKYVAKWDGSSWSPLGSGMNGDAPQVLALAVSGSDLYVGGWFTAAGDSAVNSVAKWNGSSWSALGSGMSDYVEALAVSGNDLYVEGQFKTAGGSAAGYIARWNGSNWSALGSGMNNIVYAIAVSGSDLYAGGQFTMAGGSAANHIAKWNGSGWSALGSGLDRAVYSLAVSGGDLYAGGDFTTAGGSAANRIAKWNGNSWSPLGSWMNNIVFDLAVSGSNLYAGGSFTMAGGSAANYIARWDGSSWSPLGSGMNRAVYSLAVSGGDLYVGGDFTMAGGSAANRIAKWNGTGWSRLGSGMDGPVYALAVSGTDLYAGGSFTMAGGRPANRIAKWNGSSWSPLGSGMIDGGGLTPTVNALAVSGSDLYAGGRFRMAGGKGSAHVARAYLERPYLSILRSGGEVTLTWPTFYAGFVLQQNPDAASPGSWSPANYPLTTNGAMKSATVPLTPTNRFFRLIGN